MYYTKYRSSTSVNVGMILGETFGQMTRFPSKSKMDPHILLETDVLFIYLYKFIMVNVGNYCNYVTTDSICFVKRHLVKNSQEMIHVHC
jgi:hypothetical protein